MDGDNDPSALAWVWVIEALSTFEEISNSTLQGLIDAAPVKHDEFSEKTKKLIAMRCLEKLSTHVVEPGASSTLDSSVGFNVLPGCEDVLQETLNEIPLKLKKTGAELSKWDVYPFIKNKRAGIFKCHLEQLRESILEGTHPHTDYLKGRSLLFPQSNSYTVLVDDRKRDDHSDKDAGNYVNAENIGEKKNSVSLILEDGNKSSKEHLLDNNFSPSKRSRVYPADDHLARHLHEKQVCRNDCDDFLRNSKRIKCYASTSFEPRKEKPDSHLRQQVSEHLTERTPLISEQGEHHAENNNKDTLGDGSFIAEPCNNASMDETDGTAHHAIPTNIANAEKNQHMISLHQPRQKEPDITSLNFSQKPLASDKTIIDMVNGCGADEYHDEKNYLEAKKHEFLHSHSLVDKDFSTMTESTEQNLCMKCNEGGQLLACKTTTCPLMVHKNCLGASAQLDAEGIFFCPLCAYSHAISEYIEAKKKVSLARKELDIFISKGIQNEAAELVHEFQRQEHCFSRKSSESEHIHVENNEDDQLTGCEDNRVDYVGEHANEANNMQFERSQQEAPISCREKENVNNGSVEVLRQEEIGEIPNAKSLTGGRVEENEVPTDHVDVHVGDEFTCGETNIATVNQNNAGEEVPQEMTRQNNIDEIELVCAHDTEKEENEVPTDHVDVHVGDEFTCAETNIAAVNQNNAGEEVPQEATRQNNIDETIKPVCAHDTEKEEISGDECKKHSTTRYSMRLLKHETQYKLQASPVFLCNQLRRKKIPWTAEEEELIREGMQKFGFDDRKKWKKILAFGSHVFEKVGKRRTPQDLKDKWKNMCKAQAKSKCKSSFK